ncbi:hypothetical protein Adt_20951 [Abeliophyllum distichum]|uniref:Uncharacterized protein n=1 Tax=Abeliophyllum distichum TaxID=126358 RepID=A0ABD1SXY8_9LAMI
MFNNVEHTMQPIGNNSTYFTHLVGNQVRFTMLPCYPSCIESYFDLQSDRSPDKYWAVCVAVAADRYRDYKLKVHNHLNEHGPSHPYSELSVEDLQKYNDIFTSSTFMGVVPEDDEDENENNGGGLEDL